MMKKYLLALLAFSILFTACQQETTETEEVETPTSIMDDIKGTWEVKYFKVEVDSYQNQDSSFVFEIGEDKWSKVYGVRPFRTFFAPDSTFRTLRRDLGGNIIGEDRGLWRAFGDTLMMIQPNATFNYKVLIEQGQAQWGGVIDWDYDGVEDDVYVATYRYVGKTSNE